MFMNQNATQERSKIIAIIAACGMSLAAASFTVTTHAQNQQDHMEWEPDEGFHEEEWYDPSDWFDDDFDGISGPDTDYEYDNNYGWTDNGYDYAVGETTGTIDGVVAWTHVQSPAFSWDTVSSSSCAM